MTRITAALDSQPSSNSSASNLTMTKTEDTNDGTCSAADCSLREAIAVAASGDEVVVPSGIYTLTSLFELTIEKSLTVTGAGSGDTIIQATTQPEVADFRVLKITEGVVGISGVTIRHGKPNSNGGGIYNSGTLTLTNSTVSGNEANGNGGGIYHDGSALTIINSTVSANTASGVGGGIFAGDNSTVSLANALIAGNTASIRPDWRGLLTSLGHNLIGDTTGCSFTPATGDLVNVAPMLGLLQDNGGPTLTHALLASSRAIDAGNPAVPGADEAACPQTDQRGVVRPQGAACDIGAFEFMGTIPPRAFDQAVATTGDRPVTIVLKASDPDTGDKLAFILVSLRKSGDLPWEASEAALELLAYVDHRRGGAGERPSVRFVRWFWRVSQARPGAGTMLRVKLAEVLTISPNPPKDVLGDSP